MATRGPIDPSDDGVDVAHLIHDSGAFARHVVDRISRRMASGVMTADDWSVEGPEVDVATGASIFRYVAELGPYAIRLDHTSRKVAGKWVYRLAVIDDAHGLGYAGSDDAESAIAHLIGTVRDAVAAHEVRGREAVLRLLGD